MQKIIVLDKKKKKKKKMDKAQHLLKLGSGVIKGALVAWKNTQYSNFLYW